MAGALLVWGLAMARGVSEDEAVCLPSRRLSASPRLESKEYATL
jgi:hypothetical protein